MFAQSPSTPFSSAPNLVAPRLAFELLSSRGQIGRKLKDAKCQLLFVYASNDDMIPPAVTRSVIEDATSAGAGAYSCDNDNDFSLRKHLSFPLP